MLQMFAFTHAHRRRLAGLTGLLLLLLIAAPAVRSNQFTDGRQAFLAGDYERALQLWRPLAEAGDRRAQFGLGTLHYEGAGVDRDMAEAARWFRRSAEQGYPPAEFNLGNAYKHGRGVEQSDEQANLWWLKAAEQEFAPAQYNLGTQYYFGRGVAKDRARAIEWYRRAALNGHVGARRLFGIGSAVAGETPSPARPVEAGAGVARRVEREPWLLTQDPGRYTVQIAALGSEAAAIDYAHRTGSSGEVAYFSILRDGRRLYPVVYGSFRDRAEAEQGAAALPAALREGKPWIRRFEEIQNSLRPARDDAR